MAKKILSGIYRIDGPTGKFYVGSAKHIPRRWIEHRRDLRKKDHPNPKFQCAWNKHGEEAFKLSILELVPDIAQLIEREQHWIDSLDAVKSGYNITPTAGSLLGIKHSDETRRKMSEAKLGIKHGPMSAEQKQYYSELYKGKTLSAETRRKMSESRMGRKFSIESKRKMSESRKGIQYSEETKAKISAGLTGKKHSEKTRAKMKASQAFRMPISEETRQRMRDAAIRRYQAA